MGLAGLDFFLAKQHHASLGVGTIIQFGPCGLLVPCFSLIGVFDQHCTRVWPLRSSILAVGES